MERNDATDITSFAHVALMKLGMTPKSFCSPILPKTGSGGGGEDFRGHVPGWHGNNYQPVP